MIFKRKYFRSIIFNLIGIFILLLILFPIFWLIDTSFKTDEEIYSLPIEYLPQNPTLSNYKSLLTGGTKETEALQWPQYLLNSAIASGISTIITMIFASLAGYALSRFRFKGRNALLSILIGSRMLPGPVLIVPIYFIIARIGLYNTLWSLILVYTAFGLPLCSWIASGFFKSIPMEVEEAALIDGCSRIKSFIHVILPMAWIGLASVGIYHFIGAWSEFAFASILIESQKKWTTPVGLVNFLYHFGSAWFNKIGAAAVIMSVPIIIMFMMIQRHFVRGFLAGSLKE